MFRRTGRARHHAFLAPRHCLFQRGEDQRIARRKMSIERAVRKPCAAHAIGDPQRFQAVLADLPRCRIQHALPALRFLCL
jgi:hypothetical protein